MKPKYHSFNFWFNLFILLGMVTAVVIVNAFKLQEPGVQVVKQEVIALGAVLGVVNTVLSANGNIWTFLFGVLDVCICAYANYDSGNMGQFFQHVLYFLPMQFVGLWQWRKRGAGVRAEDGGTARVRPRRLTGRQWALVAGAVLLGSALAYAILYGIDVAQLHSSRITEIDRGKILLDAVVVVLNITGQVLLSFAYADQWYIWNLVNVFSILLWTNRLLSPQASSYTLVMVIKYAFYLLNSINGLRIWLQLSRETAPEAAPESAREAVPDAAPEAAPESAREAAPDAAPEGAPDFAREAVPEAPRHDGCC